MRIKNPSKWRRKSITLPMKITSRLRRELRPKSPGLLKNLRFRARSRSMRKRKVRSNLLVRP